jgi:hypothetical protein
MHSEKENEIPRTKSFKEYVGRYILICAKRVKHLRGKEVCKFENPH